MHVPRSAVAGSRRPMFVAKRRRRLWPLLLALGLIAAGAVSVTAGERATSSLVGSDSADAAPQPQLAEAPEVDPPEPDVPTPPLATFGGLALHLPTERPIIVGFHEASTPEALEMGPTGRLEENENTTKFEPPEEVEEGTDYLVMASRGRPRAATSAVDVVMHVNDPVLSPVSGTVTDVRTYHLYGAHEDYRIEIAPDDAPELRLVLIHLDELEVAEGDEVRAGETVLAGTARPFPFSSQIDRYTEPKRWPHVHIEVKVADDADGGDGERRSATG
jgi:murein DD-endopeptidase MepM/ murein hydrolase activator NlpD